MCTRLPHTATLEIRILDDDDGDDDDSDNNDGFFSPEIVMKS